MHEGKPGRRILKNARYIYSYYNQSESLRKLNKCFDRKTLLCTCEVTLELLVVGRPVAAQAMECPHNE